MPLQKGYAVLKGHVISGVPAKPGKDHYSVDVVDDEKDYRIAVEISAQMPRTLVKICGSSLMKIISIPSSPLSKTLPLGRKIFQPNATAAERKDSGSPLTLSA